MIPSPKVATYDKEPKMSVKGVAEKVAEVVKKGDKELLVEGYGLQKVMTTQGTQVVCYWRAGR